MMDPNKTPNRAMPPIQHYQDGVPAPPRYLLFGVIGFCLMIIAVPVAGIFVFNNIFSPAQQERVITELPFMETFLYRPPTPVGGVLPTSEAPDSADSADDLLSLDIGGVNATEPAAQAIATATATETALPPTATPTPTSPPPTSTPTLLPTIAATAVPQATTAASAADGATVLTSATRNIPPTARIFGLRWTRQTWNNCGPATITIALSFYGWQEDQSYAGNMLKPNREDKNVSPHELVEFVNEQTGVNAMMRMGGDLDVLRALLAANLPVVIERGIMFEANDWLGHYQALVAYSDNDGLFYTYDSIMGTGNFEQGVEWSYEQLDEDWRHFNRKFIVLYQDSEAGLVESILGDLYDEDQAALNAFEVAQQEARQNPQDGHAWFNMGTALVALERYEEAANAYNRAVNTGNLPWRMLWYQFGPYEAYYQTGRYDDLLSIVQSVLNQAPELEEAYYWRGRVYEAQGNPAQAAVQYRTALGYNPNFEEARTALNAVDAG